MKKMRTILSIALGITAIGLITSCSSGAAKKAAALEELEDDEEGGNALTVIAIIIAVLLVILLVVILILNFFPDTGAASAISSVLEKVTNLFASAPGADDSFLL